MLYLEERPPPHQLHWTGCSQACVNQCGAADHWETSPCIGMHEVPGSWVRLLTEGRGHLPGLPQAPRGRHAIRAQRHYARSRHA